MDHTTLIELTADIVSAHLGHNRVDLADVPRVIDAVYVALADAAQSATTPIEARPEPAVPIRSSLKADAIVCLACGARMKMLKRHLRVDHDQSPADYRTRWDLPHDYPMVALAYSETRRAIARETGLGRKAVVRQFEGNQTAAPTGPAELEPEAAIAHAE
ncbi:MucR family transcriptional regulator [Novosphingobium sp. G106]|uniref:MucR family transcriptional regulator n=1 Tax=Novosphingobium sp. G106 TaxID=2849500 RepID=UPI001C2DB30B|nr:MucR family transcriptional regulator [Novosphingobium sp. G106]MBV1691404.1 MucR family transcriptional regulator [Novosphingobium sp. G106]